KRIVGDSALGVRHFQFHRIAASKFLFGNFALPAQAGNSMRFLQFGGLQLQALLFEQACHEAVGKILATEEALAGSRDDFERAFKYVHERDVECSAAEVDHQDFLLGVAVVKSVRE